MTALGKLIRVFGVPSGLETGCFIGGRDGHRILRRKGKGTEETGLFVGGPMDNVIISGAQRIGFVALNSVQRIYASGGKEPNYFVGGETGRKIMYLKRKSN